MKINAPACIVAIGDKRGDVYTNIGFVLQQVVLRLTENGFGTCWLGTFNKDTLANMCDIKENEEVVCVVALGHREESFWNNGFHKIAGSLKRKGVSEITYINTWGNKSEDIEGNIKETIYLSSLAPSGMNKRPTRVILERGIAHFVTENNKWTKIDGGIFMAHFFMSSLEMGRKCNVKRIVDVERLKLLTDTYYLCSMEI